MSCRTLKSERMISKINDCIKQKKKQLARSVFGQFSKTHGAVNVKNVGHQLFQVATSFHPGHRKQKTRYNSRKTRVTSNKPENYFRIFFWSPMCFWGFKVTPKDFDKAPLIPHEIERKLYTHLQNFKCAGSSPVFV